MNNDVKNRLNSLLRAIEYEREEEREIHLNEMMSLDGAQREEKGRAIIDLRKKAAGRTIGGDYLFSFRKNNNKTLSDTQINIGDQVILSQTNPLDDTNPIGIVYEIDNKNIIISVSKALKMSNSIPIRIDLFVNDITYKRMEDTLIKVKTHMYSKLQTILSGHYSSNTSVSGFKIDDLNEIQNTSVDYALGNNGFYSIQGPPGTGKTYTASFLIKEIIKHKKKILITADSNAAVDNLIRKCADLGLNPLRIGNPIRVNSDLKEYTLDYKVFSHVLFNDLKSIEIEIEETKEIQKTLKRPSMKLTHGIAYDELLDMVKRKKPIKGIDREVLRGLRPWLRKQKKLDDLYDKIRSVRNEIQMDLIDKHSIIASTNSTAGAELLEDIHFDWNIIDEAAQSSIPSSLIPISKANRFVLIGDHFQLPPVVINRKAKDLGLDKSFMDLLADIYPYQLIRLTMQYRMHKKINDLVSSMFYENKLIPHESVADRIVLNDNKIIEIIHVEGEERIQKDSKSYFNIQEMHIVEKKVEELLKRKIEKEQIGVISPYKAQTIKIKDRLDEEIEVDTVDAFQGREKDIIIISFVRSNIDGNIGFLKDYRRLNVSISRAKSKLILIGNIKTLKSNQMYRKLLGKI